jgi:hypothetical protein
MPLSRHVAIGCAGLQLLGAGSISPALPLVEAQLMRSDGATVAELDNIILADISNADGNANDGADGNANDSSTGKRSQEQDKHYDTQREQEQGKPRRLEGDDDKDKGNNDAGKKDSDILEDKDNKCELGEYECVGTPGERNSE